MMLQTFEQNDICEDRFMFDASPYNMAASTFTAITEKKIFVTRRYVNIAHLPPKTVVIAHWHGQYRTDAYLTTVGDLNKMANNWAGGSKEGDIANNRYVRTKDPFLTKRIPRDIPATPAP